MEGKQRNARMKIKFQEPAITCSVDVMREKMCLLPDIRGIQMSLVSGKSWLLLTRSSMYKLQDLIIIHIPILIDMNSYSVGSG